MNKRISVVNFLNVSDITSTSVLQIGDVEEIKPRSRALAVQRETEFFYGDEGDFKKFSLFSERIPKPYIDEKINIQTKNESHFIHVNSINITGLTASAIGQIGSNKVIDAESRVKHIRQLFDK